MSSARLIELDRKDDRELLGEFVQDEFADINSSFSELIGDKIPWQKANVDLKDEAASLLKIIKNSNQTEFDCASGLGAGLCCLTIVGIPYVCFNTKLIPAGSYGFLLDNGVPYIMMPGWHSLYRAFRRFVGEFKASDTLINVGPITIVRIPKGWVGLAVNATMPEVLLAGTHCRNSGTFQYKGASNLQTELIEYDPIKFLTVPTGFQRICYFNGKVRVLKAGRFAINTPLFTVGPLVSIQQQNLKFSEHKVLLNGGINLSVFGLLTYQITDVEMLVGNMGVDNLVRSIEDITKAELARVFATIHLEQISSVAYNEAFNLKASKGFDEKVEKQELHEKGSKEKLDESVQTETRIKICEMIMGLISPFTTTWGVKIVNFQLESTKLADQKYSNEYESASLAIAKAKADLQANAAQNKVLIQKSKAEADALCIKAEGEKTALIIESEGEAAAIELLGRARNRAAESMSDKFAQEFALLQERVKFADSLKATTLVISGKDDIGKNITPMLSL
ncbi:MAG: SPFH domain / Band 7 domain containing protein [Harvfovirus sp.]|uniref:SPFH domain / Band 7 domain containing protein n=1 Tax=Harvfovirus sp. TaxID=2487768 RepID=A0A3G5A5B7_9VIRU|nr:MAG: SPFH domain / Band 7 domain containing protein [Harvfovirus sp.]